MEKLYFSIVINAPKKKVWEVMLGKDTYSDWTELFSPGSYYVGDWSEGSKMLFLGPDETGQMSGMVSKIKENRPYEYVSIEHIGEVKNGKEEVTEWSGALENYTFKEIDGKTELLIKIDTVEDYKELFQDIWPKALQRLKEIAEG
jgi:Activator of Hsp90 ATPase homolog 1-like protein